MLLESCAFAARWGELGHRATGGQLIERVDHRRHRGPGALRLARGQRHRGIVDIARQPAADGRLAMGAAVSAAAVRPRLAHHRFLGAFEQRAGHARWWQPVTLVKNCADPPRRLEGHPEGIAIRAQETLLEKPHHPWLPRREPTDLTRSRLYPGDGIVHTALADVHDQA